MLVHDVLIVENLRGGAQPAEALQVGIGLLEPRPHGAAACDAKNHVMHEVVAQKEADAILFGHGLFLQRDGAVELLDACRGGTGAALHNYLLFQVLANVAGTLGKGEVDGRDIGATLGHGTHQAFLRQTNQSLAHGGAPHI